MEKPETFKQLIEFLDAEADRFFRSDDIRRERQFRVLSSHVAYCYAKEMSFWMERFHDLENQRNKAIEALGESITSNFKERLETIEEELAKEKV